MPVLNERDFAKLGADVARDLAEREIPLAASIDKLASDYGMNPEQIARLCEASNNAAFNALFEKKAKEGGDDRLVEFDVARPKDVLERRVAQAKTAQVQTKTAAVFDPIWEGRALERKAPALEKTASAAEPSPYDLEKIAREGARQARAVGKALEHLRHEKHAAALAAYDHEDALFAYFRVGDRRATEFPAFEKDAMVLGGAGADDVLDRLRAKLRLPEITRDHAKVANHIVLAANTIPARHLTQAVQAHARHAEIVTTLAAHGV